MNNDSQNTIRREHLKRERVYSPAEHERHYAPLNRELSPKDAQQFGWMAENGTVQSYEHSTTKRHIHIDGTTGQFYDREKNSVSKQAALDKAMGRSQLQTPASTAENRVTQTPPVRERAQGLSV